MTQPQSAEIHDLGYRPYDGERTGVRSAMTALGWHATQRVLGLKRVARHKILPFGTILLSFVPALVFVGMAAFLPTDIINEGILPSYSDYYGYIVQIIWLFTSFVAPEAICTDRRTGMLALYLASPLDRTTYIWAKLASVATTMLAITLLPVLFLLVAYTVEGAGPAGIVDFAELLIRIVAAGILTALYFAGISGAISSLTSRRSVASAVIVIVFLMAGIVTAALINGAELNHHISLFNIAVLPMRTATYLLGERPGRVLSIDQVDGSVALLTTVLVAAASMAFTWWRYQRIEVGR